jgi:hypothetical protein
MKMIKVGQVFYSNQKDSEWKIWHEIMSIDSNKVIVSNYGKDTDIRDVSMTKKEVNYCIKKGILIPA